MITVYSKPGCQPCRLVKMRLEKNGTEYTTVDITETDGAVDTIEALGYKAVPVVVAGDVHFQGYAPDKIDLLKD